MPKRLTTQMKQVEQTIKREVEDLNTNQKLKLLQILLQYVLPRLKHIKEEATNEPSEIQINIVKTSDELDRLNKVNAYEKEHNVKII